MSRDVSGTAYGRLIDAFEARESEIVEQDNGGAVVQCSAHEDGNPSLVLTPIRDRALVHCRAGCETADVLKSLGLAMSDLFDNRRGVTYTYTDAAGKPGRIVKRTPDKRFPQSGDLTRFELYRLPAVVEAKAAGREVYFVEGEQDVHALETLGIVATTAPQGAPSVGKVDLEPLRGARVVLVPDRDEAGKKWLATLAERLTDYTDSVRVAVARTGKDAADHIAAGHGVDELIAGELPTVEKAPELFVNGADFLLDITADAPPIWGATDVHLWAEGESLMLVGPPGVGKSTTAHLLVWGRLGLLGEAIGWPVAKSDAKVLYLAMDRPKQIARAMRRLMRPEHLPILRERLVVRNGPLPVDICDQPEWLRDRAQEIGATTVVIDSIKDVLPDPSDEKRAGLYNRARQMCLAVGIEWVELHHNRKGSVGNREPNTLDDVYGSRWLTAGAGSVISLYGEAGDTVVSMKQLKTPAGEFFPCRVLLDKDAGQMRPYENLTISILLGQAGKSGISARRMAEKLFTTDKPSASNVETIRGRLKRLVRSGEAEEFASQVDGGQMFRAAAAPSVGPTPLPDPNVGPTPRSTRSPTVPTSKASAQVKGSNVNPNTSNVNPNAAAPLKGGDVGVGADDPPAAGSSSAPACPDCGAPFKPYSPARGWLCSNYPECRHRAYNEPQRSAS